MPVAAVLFDWRGTLAHSPPPRRWAERGLEAAGRPPRGAPTRDACSLRATRSRRCAGRRPLRTRRRSGQPPALPGRSARPSQSWPSRCRRRRRQRLPRWSAAHARESGHHDADPAAAARGPRPARPRPGHEARRV